MPKLLAILSPSKKMATPEKLPDVTFSQPAFRKLTETLLRMIRQWGEDEIRNNMAVSATIARETIAMHKSIHYPMEIPLASPAMLTFSGDVYRGLEAQTFSEKQLIHAHDCLRILSGMYGYLKPLELIQPYRMMMGTPIKELEGKSTLSSFWKPHITKAINAEINEKDILVNLASQEYSNAIDEHSIHASVVRCDFREIKNGKAVSVSTYAKIARGLMARYIILESPKNIAALKKFNLGGYTYNEELSTEKTLMFTR
jgi:cytoplasmic iron level regulating protein YaaA (DUF328/UPF0246 family)